MYAEDLDGTQLSRYPIVRKENIAYLNGKRR